MIQFERNLNQYEQYVMANPKLNTAAVRRWAIDAVHAGKGNHLASLLAAHFGVSRITANRAIKKLVEENWLASSGGTTRPIYSLGPNRSVAKKYRLPDIDENLIWVTDFAPVLNLSPNVMDILHYGFTEIMNNANDHSEGTCVYVTLLQKNGEITVVIGDDGIGIFEKITQAMNLPDKRLAILELSKGKFTTDPSNHSGEGIFFTSRMFDHFTIKANGLGFDHDVDNKHDWLLELDGIPAKLKKDLGIGTLITMDIPVDSQRTCKEIFDEYSSTDGDYGFEKTVVPVRLAKIGNENLVSRSQAKRLVARFEGFKTVLLDFEGINEIGQAFADQIFRVFTNSHPHIDLIPIKANQAVMQMISRAKTHRLSS